MSCSANGAACSNAARRNGIWGLSNRFLNTVGSWETYRDLKSVAEIPARLEQVALGFFGLNLAGDTPRLGAAMLAAVVGVHALEYATGSAATFAVRTFNPGKMLAKYGGCIIRESRMTPMAARRLDRLTGGRLVQASGYYLHEGGKTWHCQSFTFNVKGTPRTVTRIQTLSIPYRELIFDRPLSLDLMNEPGEGESWIGDDGGSRSLSMYRIVDTIKGHERPENIPGFIGSTNELENTAGLGFVKRALFAANWYLVDESERDIPTGPDFVDYDALIQGKPPGGGQGHRSPGGASVGTAGASVGQAGDGGYYRVRGGATRLHPLGQSYGDVYEQIRDRYRDPNGYEYPLVIDRVAVNPVTGRDTAVARYFDPVTRRWLDLKETGLLEQLAADVRAGRRRLNPDYY